MTIIAEAQVIVRPITQNFSKELDTQVQQALGQTNKKAVVSPTVSGKNLARDLDKQVSGGINLVNKKAIISPKIDDKGQTAKFTGALSKLNLGLQGVGKSGTVTGTVLSKLGATGGTVGQLLGGALPTAALAGAAAITAFAVKGVHDFLSLADSVRQFQIISGASASDASKLVAVTSALGVSSQAAGTGVFFLEKNLDKTAPKLEGLGIQVAKTKDGNLDLTATFLNVADAISRTEDPAKRAEIAFTAFGRGGKALLPILAQGREGIQALIDEAQKSGQIINQKQVDQAFKFRLELHHLGEEAGSFGRSIGSIAVPALAELAHLLSEGIDDARGFFGEFAKLGHDPLGVLKDIGRFLSPFPPAAKTAAQSAADLHTKVVAVNQEMDVLAHQQNITGPQLQKLADDLSAAGFSADQASGLIDSVTTASEALGTQATKTINQINALGVGITHAFGDTKHQVLEWQKSINDSFNLVEGDLGTLAGKSHLSAKDIVKDFTDQLKAEGELSANFDTLLKRHLPADFIKQLAEMGAKGAPLVSALANANSTQFKKIVQDWEQAQHHAPDISNKIRHAFLDPGPIKIPVGIQIDVPHTKKTLADFRNAVREKLEGGLPVTATPKVTTPNVSITATNVTISGKFKAAAFGGFLQPGEIGLTGERGPELQVGGRAGTTIIPNNKLGGFTSQDVDRIIAAIEKAIQLSRPINVNEVAQSPVATAEAVAARLGLAGVR